MKMLANSSRGILFLLIAVLVLHSTSFIDCHQKLPLKTYEKLNFNDFKFELSVSSENTFKSRNKRHITSSLESPILDTNRLKFSAFNRNFEIYLKRDTSLLANNVDIEVRSSSKPTRHLNDFLTSNYYSGYVNGESMSHVICYFENSYDFNTTLNTMTSNQLEQPLVYAQIHIQSQNESTIYYIEPSINFDSAKGHDSLKDFKYLIYKIDDIDSDVISNNVFNSTVCKPKYVNEPSSLNEGFISYLSKNNFLDTSRKKRQVVTNTSYVKDAKERQNRCNLALVADYRFFKEIGNSNVKLTTSYLMNVIASINSIFTKTKWNLDEEDEEGATNYGFYIDKIIVHSEPTLTANEHYNSANSSTNSDRILELFGEEDWSAYCLAHLFTYVGFENNVLGLAYVSSPLPGTQGGICSKSFRRNSRFMSVNTGLSSYKSASQRQGRLLQREAEIVTAHELGHNWGSEHDPLSPECTPESGIKGGYYIMYMYSNQGHEKNNYLFSPCSINYISEVLKTKKKCFKVESKSYCGNDRIEDGEECDAGFPGRQGLDKCCDYNCKLRPGAQCSDANHYCCNNCQIASAVRQCFASTNYVECFEERSFCDGVSKDCPPPKPKPAYTPCYSFDSGRCDSAGHCLSLCQQQDPSYLPCKCTYQKERCMVCCRNAFVNTSDECRPLHVTFSNYYKSPKYLTNGRPCVEGFCENEVCIQRVKDYVSRFWKVIQTVTVSGFVEFMKRNIVGSIITVSLAFWVPISCCIHFCIDKRNIAYQKQKIRSNENYNQSLADNSMPQYQPRNSTLMHDSSF